MPPPIFHVYVVDDEPSVRTAYARLLRSAGMESTTFATVEDLLASSLVQAGGCVVSDVRMPGANALDLPELLARSGRQLPVIFTTAHDTEEMRATAQRSGAVAFFRKPVDDLALLDAITWAIRERSLGGEGGKHHPPDGPNIDRPRTTP